MCAGAASVATDPGVVLSDDQAMEDAGTIASVTWTMLGSTAVEYSQDAAVSLGYDVHACDGDRCADVECTAGAVCAPADGLCHCASETGPACTGTQLCDVGAVECVDVPEPVCGAGTRWTAGTRSFEERTIEPERNALCPQCVSIHEALKCEAMPPPGAA